MGRVRSQQEIGQPNAGIEGCEYVRSRYILEAMHYVADAHACVRLCHSHYLTGTSVKRARAFCYAECDRWPMRILASAAGASTSDSLVLH